MLNSKGSIERWAKEIYRCEGVISDAASTTEEVEQAEWKVTAIMSIYKRDIEKLILLMTEVEKLFFETFDK